MGGGGGGVTNVGGTCGPTPLLAIYAIKYVYTTLCVQLLLQFEADSFETLQETLQEFCSWPEDARVV